MKTLEITKDALIEADIELLPYEIDHTEFLEDLTILEHAILNGKTKTTLNLRSEQARH
jgi:hypothetical protein